MFSAFCVSIEVKRQPGWRSSVCAFPSLTLPFFYCDEKTWPFLFFSRHKLQRKHHYSDEEGDEEEQVRRKKSRKVDVINGSDSDSGEELHPEVPQGPKHRARRSSHNGLDAVSKIENGDETTEDSSARGSSSKPQAPAFRPQRSTRVVPKDLEGDEAAVARRESSKGDHPRALTARKRSTDSLGSKDSLLSEQAGSGVVIVGEDKNDVQPMEVSTGDTIPTEPEVAVPEQPVTAPQAETPDIEAQKALSASPDSDESPEPVVAVKTKQETKAAEAKAKAAQKQENLRSKIARSTKGSRKPTLKALAKLKKGGHSDSEASNEDGYRSDGSVASTHSISTRYGDPLAGFSFSHAHSPSCCVW